MQAKMKQLHEKSAASECIWFEQCAKEGRTETLVRDTEDSRAVGVQMERNREPPQTSTMLVPLLSQLNQPCCPVPLIQWRKETWQPLTVDLGFPFRMTPMSFALRVTNSP